MRNKIFTKIIITTLLVTFLTFNVGRVTRVSAVATVGTVAAAAALATGVVFLSYVVLTGGEILVPVRESIDTWVSDIGTKVSQYPSGRSVYKDFYQKALAYPLNPLQAFEDVYTWTREKLMIFTNDFSSTDVIQNIISYSATLDVSQIPNNGYNYGNLNIVSIPSQVWNGSTYVPFSTFVNQGYTFSYPTGVEVLSGDGNGNYSSVKTNATGEYRNIYHSGSWYVQKFVNGSWEYQSGWVQLGIYLTGAGLATKIISPRVNLEGYEELNRQAYLGSATSVPIMIHQPCFIESTGQYLEMTEVDEQVEVLTPDWVGNYNGDDEDDKRPIIPFTQLPNNGNWGFNLDDLLDALYAASNALIDIGALQEIINAFKDSLAGTDDDAYYIYYDDGTYDYYSIANNNDNRTVYNINVSNVDEQLPVDLNTIQTYSNNRYLEQIKQSAINGSSIVRDLAVFWYDVDPEVTYIVLGCCILILIGAFTGKLGHS